MHIDEMTDAQLRAAEFTGTRNNAWARTLEWWVLGDKKVSVSWTKENLSPGTFEREVQEMEGLPWPQA